MGWGRPGASGGLRWGNSGAMIRPPAAMPRPGPLARLLGFVALAAGVVALGWWIGSTATPPRRRPAAPVAAADARPLRHIPAPKPRETKTDRDFAGRLVDLDALDAGALPGQRTLTFRDAAAMRRFLDSLDGSGLRLLGVLDALNTVRVGFDDLAALDHLPDDADPGLIYPVYVPDVPPADAQAGAVALGSGLLEWLGISGDVSGWGRGVTIAILDTGVAVHPALGGRVSQFYLVPLPVDPSGQNGHGTAVASLIAGSHPLVPGVAPAADLLSIRVADDYGVSDSFTLAQGILDAMAAGAAIINISMGSYGHSTVLSSAIETAIAGGVVVVAAAGNDGMSNLLYPAAYPGVLGVGAVDGAGSYLEFSNTADALAAAAPGYGVNAAWPGDALISFSGTSASAPILAGAIAATMSQGDGVTLNAQQAAAVVLANLNEAGFPGDDPLYGGGLLDLGRVMRRDEAGVVDAAVASQVLDWPEGGGSPQLLVTVENRGTEMLVNSSVNVHGTALGSTPLNITTLPAGQTRTFTLPLAAAPDPAAPLRIQSSVSTSTGQVDRFPANNTRAEVLAVDAAP